MKWKKNSHFLFGQRDAQSRTTDWRERHNLTHKAHTAPVSEVDNKHENNICYGASLFLLTHTQTHVRACFTVSGVFPPFPEHYKLKN